LKPKDSQAFRRVIYLMLTSLALIGAAAVSIILNNETLAVGWTIMSGFLMGLTIARSQQHRMRMMRLGLSG